MCLDPSTKRIYVSPHALFIEASFPGLATLSPPAPPASPPAPNNTPQTALPAMVDDNIDTNDDACIAPSPPQYEDATEQETVHGDHDSNDEATIAERLMRRRRQTAAVVAFNLLDTPTKLFVIYLCSGAQRDDDMAEFLIASDLQVVQVGYVRGGIGHDMARDEVADRVATLAADKLCVAVVASPPCSTWSAARFEPGAPQ
eukprot:1524081-Pleurochrysis_carterae.AAC.1